MPAAFQFLLLRCVDDYTSLSEKQYCCTIPSDTSEAAIEERLEMLHMELVTDRCMLDDIFQRLQSLIGRWKQRLHEIPAGSPLRGDAGSKFYSFLHAHELLKLLPAITKLQFSLDELIHGSVQRHAEPITGPYGPALEEGHKQVPSGRVLTQTGSYDPTCPAKEPYGSTPPMPSRHELQRHRRRRAAVFLLKRFAHLSHTKQRFLDRPASVKHRQILSRRKWFLRRCTCHRCRWTGPWTRWYYPMRREMDRLYGTSVSRHKRACIRLQSAGSPFDPGSSQPLPSLRDANLTTGNALSPSLEGPMHAKHRELKRHLAHPTVPPSITSMDDDIRELERHLAEDFVYDKNGMILGYTDEANPYEYVDGEPRLKEKHCAWLRERGPPTPLEPVHVDDLELLHQPPFAPLILV
ncbi:hypothetical protein AAVH_29272 [Aphelenchoides avenae]|nr:hypothetical protein AAVH_29272 [Aphelenchus avenae]